VGRHCRRGSILIVAAVIFNCRWTAKRSEKEKGDLFEHLVRAVEVVQLPLQRVHKNVLGSSFDPDGGEFGCLTLFPAAATRQSTNVCAYLCVRTTIDLPDQLFREAKSLALHRGISLKEFLTEATRRALSTQLGAAPKMTSPPIARATAGRIPARTNEELASILGGEDARKAR